MQLEIVEEGDAALIRITARRLEARIADRLASRMAGVFDNRTIAVIDFSQVGFIDSAGMKAMMNVLMACRKKQGACVLHGVCEDIMSVFVITRLSRLLPVATDREQALSLARHMLVSARGSAA